MSDEWRKTNAGLTEQVALVTGSRWCRSCNGWSNASKGRMQDVRSRHGFTKRWICGGCMAGRAAHKAVQRAKAAPVAKPEPVAEPA